MYLCIYEVKGKIMRVEELIKKLKALQDMHGNYKVFLKENEFDIKIVEDAFYEEALMLDDTKNKKHRYFLIS